MAETAESEFADRLRALREEADLTQQQLADRSGVHRVVIARLEGKKAQPTWRTVVALAKALGCKPNHFLADVEE